MNNKLGILAFAISILELALINEEFIENFASNKTYYFFIGLLLIFGFFLSVVSFKKEKKNGFAILAIILSSISILRVISPIILIILVGIAYNSF